MLEVHHRGLKVTRRPAQHRLAIGLIVITGCCVVSRTPIPSPDARLIANVPFFPQAPNECGPAALASLLGFFGHRVTPSAIAAEVYEPAAGGSSTVAMLTYGARHQLPIQTLRGDLADVYREIDANRPLIALHRQGLPFRDYHYIVVTGYDPRDGTVYGYSGRNPRAHWSSAEFARRWSAADNWLLVWSGSDGKIAAPADGGARSEDHAEPGEGE